MRSLLCVLASGCLATAAVFACSSSPSGGGGPGPLSEDDAGEVGPRVAPPGIDAEVPVNGPELLSQTGLYSDFASRTLAPEVMPFAPRYSLWADGLEKSRWLYLPPGTKIDTSAMDNWVFPIGTKVWKEFRLGNKVIETRLMMKVREDAPRGWWMAAYVWKEDGSDAVSTPNGIDDAFGTGHEVPNHTDCQNCHQGVSDVLIGVSAIQLSHTGEGYAFESALNDASVVSDAGPKQSVLSALSAGGRLSNPPAGDFDIPGTGDVKDALGYLHANCGSCHNDQSIRLNLQTAMRLRLLVSQTTPEQTGAYTTTIGTVMKHPINDSGSTDIVVPGVPEQSGLWLRMNRRDSFAMPPEGTSKVDDAAVEVMRRWISGLK